MFVVAVSSTQRRDSSGSGFFVWKKCAAPTPPMVQRHEPRSSWSRVERMPPPRWRKRVMPAQSPSDSPSPASTANSHSSSYSDSSSLPSTGSFPSASRTRSRAVTSHSASPASPFSDARCSRSIEKRAMLQSSAVSGIVVCNRMRIGLFMFFSLY
jgi:hypothetical protein